MKTTTWPAWAMLSCILFLGGCTGERSYEKPLRPVRAAPVEERVMDSGLRYSASIDPYMQVNLAFKVSGYVRDILQARGADGKMRNIQEGDVVRKGTVLARIVPDDFVQRLNEAKSVLGSASASLERASLDFTRTKNLFATQSVTKPDYDREKALYEEALSRVAGAKAQVEQARIQLSYCDLKAPVDGVLLSRNIEVGTLASPTSAAFVLADLTSVKAVFGVPDSMLQECRLGDTIAISTESYRGVDFKGRVTAVSPSADSKSRVFNIEITIPNSDNRLKAGMIASLEVSKSQRSSQKVNLVPLSAIVRSKNFPDGYALFALDDSQGMQTARLRDVKLGEVYGNRIEITEGVQSGSRVIVTGSTLVTDGEQVRVIP